MTTNTLERWLRNFAHVATILSAMRGLTYVVIIVGLPLLSLQALPLLERAVVVLENLDDRVERMFEAAAPVGRAGLQKGVQTLHSIDAATLGDEITEAARRKLREFGKKGQR